MLCFFESSHKVLVPHSVRYVIPLFQCWQIFPIFEINLTIISNYTIFLNDIFFSFKQEIGQKQGGILTVENFKAANCPQL